MKTNLGTIVTVGLLAGVIATAVVLLQWSATARTYSIRTVFQMAYVVWNEEQLLVVVRTRHDGSFATVLEDVRGRVKSLWGSRTERPQSTHRSVATILDIDAGGVREISQVVPSYREVTYPPRFIGGHPYLMGGIWTGARVEDVPREVQMQMRRPDIRPAGGDDPGDWQFAMLMPSSRVFPYPPRSSALPVRVRGEAMTFRATDDTTEVVIDLVRADGTTERVWTQPTTPRAVSARMFETVLGRTHPQ